MPARRILILGGTGDARQLAQSLVTDGFHVITSLAGVTTDPALPPGEPRIGGFGGIEGLQSYIADERIELVIDATHPFAARMSVHAFEACRASHVPLLRFERPAWVAGDGDRWIEVNSAEEAAAVLPSGAHILLTTGRKDLSYFFARRDLSGIARMIEESPLAAPATWRILRDRPPYTLEGEAKLLSENAITHLVTKNAGGMATEAKLVAARDARIPVVMIARPVKPEVPSLASIGNLAAAVNRLLCP